MHYRLLDNADIHIARGLALCVRADYAYLKPEFQKLKDDLASARAKAPVRSTIAEHRETIDALIMKGGGVKGLAFAGAICELQKHFSFRIFVGTSAGSIAAALLAAGATGAELEEKLRRKSFRDFLDGHLWSLPITIWTLPGLHPGITFMDWLREELHQYVPKAADVELKDLPKRAVIYAATTGSGEITFDTNGERADTAVHTAVRCSISIPYFFQPQSINNRRVFDGGLLHSYPVEIFLSQEKQRNPQASALTFIALYLGTVRPFLLKPRPVIADLLSIWLERNDAQIIDRYREDTVVIDTSPISTIDFDLSDDEKDFLVIEGRAAALEFLAKRGSLDRSSVPVVGQTRADAEKLRAKINDARRKRRVRRQVIVMISGVAMIVALGFLVFR